MEIKNSIYKISLLLGAIILLPTIIYSVYEMTTLNKNEKMISKIYEQQLDAILFSVNQHLWDHLNGWQSRIRTIQAEHNSSLRVTEYQTMVNELPSLDILALSDSLLSHWEFYNNSDYQGGTDIFRHVLVDNWGKNPVLLQRMSKYQNVKYSKVETISFVDSSAGQQEKLILYYRDTQQGSKMYLVYLLIDLNEFINTVLAPKIEEIAGNQFEIGVFSSKAQQLIYQNTAVQINELKQTRTLWLLPDYKLGIRLRGESIEELARSRFFSNLLMIIGIDLILLLGAWIVFKMIRQQMQLAQMKSDFVSNVSHELRTPLALIRMYAETLEMGRITDGQKQQEYFRIISGEAERLSRLINNILNFSRIEAGKKEYHFQEVNLNGIIKNLLEMYEYHIRSEGFELSVNLDPDLPGVVADEEAITEAMLNLLDNAIKYSEQHKFIAIRSFQSNGKVCIQVEDHGIGILASQAKYIFDKFYRASSVLIHNTRGSGLGLTLVKHIMEAHQGRVELESTPGKGSCFSLIFTIKK